MDNKEIAKRIWDRIWDIHPIELTDEERDTLEGIKGIIEDELGVKLP